MERWDSDRALNEEIVRSFLSDSFESIESVRYLAREVAICRMLSGRIALDVPEFTDLLPPSAHFSYPVVVYPMIPGKTANTLDEIPCNIGAPAAREIGTTLRELHSIDPSEFPVDTGEAEPSDPGYWVEHARKNRRIVEESVSARACAKLARFTDEPSLFPQAIIDWADDRLFDAINWWAGVGALVLIADDVESGAVERLPFWERWTEAGLE